MKSTIKRRICYALLSWYSEPKLLPTTEHDAFWMASVLDGKGVSYSSLVIKFTKMVEESPSGREYFKQLGEIPLETAFDIKGGYLKSRLQYALAVLSARGLAEIVPPLHVVRTAAGERFVGDQRDTYETLRTLTHRASRPASHSASPGEAYLPTLTFCESLTLGVILFIENGLRYGPSQEELFAALKNLSLTELYTPHVTEVKDLTVHLDKIRRLKMVYEKDGRIFYSAPAKTELNNLFAFYSIR